MQNPEQYSRNATFHHVTFFLSNIVNPKALCPFFKQDKQIYYFKSGHFNIVKMHEQQFIQKQPQFYILNVIML